MNSNLRIGLGIDVHKFSNKKGLSLLCLKWDDEYELEADSDGDVAAHAIADSILSAVGGEISDIGQLLGVHNPEVYGISGKNVLKAAYKYMKENNASIINIAVEVVCNSPKISTRRREAEGIISRCLEGVPVTVSSTTTDKLGFLGRTEGIACIANALIVFH